MPELSRQVDQSDGLIGASADIIIVPFASCTNRDGWWSPIAKSSTFRNCLYCNAGSCTVLRLVRMAESRSHRTRRSRSFTTAHSLLRYSMPRCFSSYLYIAGRKEPSRSTGLIGSSSWRRAEVSNRSNHMFKPTHRRWSTCCGKCARKC